MEKKIVAFEIGKGKPTISELIKGYARNRQYDLAECEILMSVLLFQMEIDKKEFLTFWAPLLDGLRKEFAGDLKDKI
jgi:hypothetical protein